MPIYQINIWVCEVCSKSYTTSQVVDPYNDPVVIPPNDIEWEYTGEDEKLTCPECYSLIGKTDDDQK